MGSSYLRENSPLLDSPYFRLFEEAQPLFLLSLPNDLGCLRGANAPLSSLPLSFIRRGGLKGVRLVNNLISFIFGSWVETL